MKLLINRLGAFLTGSDLADAVLHYGLALARRRELDLVDVPYRRDDGSIARVRMTIGWRAETSSVDFAPSREALDELVEPDTTLAMYDKASSIDATHATVFAVADSTTQLDWDVDLKHQL